MLLWKDDELTTSTWGTARRRRRSMENPMRFYYLISSLQTAWMFSMSAPLIWLELMSARVVRFRTRTIIKKLWFFFTLKYFCLSYYFICLSWFIGIFRNCQCSILTPRGSKRASKAIRVFKNPLPSYVIGLILVISLGNSCCLQIPFDTFLNC